MSPPLRALRAFVDYCVPPVEQRTPWTLQTLPLLAISGLTYLGAAHIRLRYPNTPFLIRLLYVLIAIPLQAHTTLSRYFWLEWHTWDGVSHSLIKFNFVSGMSAAVGALVILELLFLGDDADFAIRDAELMLEAESKKSDSETSRDKHASNGRAAAAGQDARTSKAHTKTSDERLKALQRPILFPGTFVPLELDIVNGVRGLGYGRGLPQSTAGYRAILEAEKLAAQPASVARARKWQLLKEGLKTTLKSYALLDLTESFIQHPAIFPSSGRHGPTTLLDARDGILGRAGPLLISVTMGYMMLLGLQYSFGFIYCVTLALTPAKRVPVTASRFYPWLIGKPWIATSNRDLWSNHWHSIFRRLLVVCAYKPTRNLTRFLRLPAVIGRGLATIAAFALSGLSHEMMLEIMAPAFASWDRRLLTVEPYYSSPSNSIFKRERGFGAFGFAMTRFFVFQAFAIILEELWISDLEPRLATLVFGSRDDTKARSAEDGKDVTKPRLIEDDWLRSRLGFVWTQAWIGVTGVLFVEPLLRHGCLTAFGTWRLWRQLLWLVAKV